MSKYVSVPSSTFYIVYALTSSIVDVYAGRLIRCDKNKKRTYMSWSQFRYLIHGIGYSSTKSESEITGSFQKETMLYG